MESTKICNKCHTEKNISEFYFRKDNNKFRNDCKDCHNERIYKKRKENPDYMKNYMKNWRKENIEYSSNYGKIWREENSDHLKSYFKQRGKENPEYRRLLYKNKMATDNLFKIKEYVRKSISSSFRYKSSKKPKKTKEILGCSFQKFKLHLESEFEPWMNWENHGLYNGTLNFGWDIDHIIPLSSAKDEEEIIKLNHYLNLQPLCSYTNRYIKKDQL